MERRLQTKICTRGTEEMLGDIRIGVRLNEKNIKLKDRTVSTNVFIYKRQVWRNVISAALKKISFGSKPKYFKYYFHAEVRRHCFKRVLRKARRSRRN